MEKKVCFLVSEHPFLDARIFKKEAKSLLKRGYKVTMIVPRKNGYLFDVNGTIFKDTFLSSVFMYEGIKVVTYEQEPLEKNIKQLFHNLRTKDSSKFNESLTTLGVKENADIYHTHEFISFYSSVGIKRRLQATGKTCKLIFDSHELEPDPSRKEGQQRQKIKQRMMEYMLNEVDYVITVSPSIQNWYRTIHPQVPIEIIYNSPPLAKLDLKELHGEKQELVLGFEGTIDSERIQFQKFIELVALCNQIFPLKLKIIGGKKKQAEQLSIPPHLSRKIEFTGWVPYDAIPAVMKDVDIGFIDLDAKNSLNSRFSLPNKFFSYLNNGIPVLVNQCTDMEYFIKKYQCGVVIQKQQANASDYYHVLRSLYNNQEKIHEMGVHARKVMESKYSWEHMEKKLYQIYDSLS